MSVAQFFSQLDGNIIGLSGTFFGTWVSVHYSLFEAVDDLNTIRNRAIHHIGSRSDGEELIDFINALRKKSYVLVLEPKSDSRNLKYALILFLAASVLAICYKAVSGTLPSWLDADVVYTMYGISFSAASIYLWIEVRYFREFRRLGKEYPSAPDEPSHLKVVQSKKSNHSLQGRRP